MYVKQLPFRSLSKLSHTAPKKGSSILIHPKTALQPIKLMFRSNLCNHQDIIEVPQTLA